MHLRHYAETKQQGGRSQGGGSSSQIISPGAPWWKDKKRLE